MGSGKPRASRRVLTGWGPGDETRQALANHCVSLLVDDSVLERRKDEAEAAWPGGLDATDRAPARRRITIIVEDA